MATRPAKTGRDLRTEPLTVSVTAMRRRHLRSVLQIEQQVYPKPWTLGLFLSELGQRSSRLYLVARVRHKVVGYIGMLSTMEDGHITTLAVEPTWQRRGIATRLLVAAGRGAIARGYQNLTLEVRVTNGSAQNLYRRFGFAPAGVRKGYYPDNREDALVMWVNDIDSPGYARRLAEIETGIRGFTVVEGDWL